VAGGGIVGEVLGADELVGEEEDDDGNDDEQAEGREIATAVEQDPEQELKEARVLRTSVAAATTAAPRAEMTPAAGAGEGAMCREK
jgi:hypothetical protein